MGLAFLGFVGGGVFRGSILLRGRVGGGVGAVGGGGGVMDVRYGGIVCMVRFGRGGGVGDGGVVEV